MHAEDFDPLELFFTPPIQLYQMGCTRVTLSRPPNIKIEGVKTERCKPQLFVGDALGEFHHIGAAFDIQGPGFQMDTVAKVLSLRWPHINFFQRLPTGAVVPIITYGGLPQAGEPVPEINPTDPFAPFQVTADGQDGLPGGQGVDVHHYTGDRGDRDSVQVEVIIPPAPDGDNEE